MIRNAQMWGGNDGGIDDSVNGGIGSLVGNAPEQQKNAPGRLGGTAVRLFENDMALSPCHLAHPVLLAVPRHGDGRDAGHSRFRRPPTLEPGVPRRPVILGRVQSCGQLQYRYVFGIGLNYLVRSAVKVCEHKKVLLLPREDAALALLTSQPTGNVSALSRPHDAVASASDASAEIGIAPED